MFGVIYKLSLKIIYRVVSVLKAGQNIFTCNIFTKTLHTTGIKDCSQCCCNYANGCIDKNVNLVVYNYICLLIIQFFPFTLTEA